MAGFEELPYLDLTLFADETRIQSFVEYIFIQNEADKNHAIALMQSALRGSILKWDINAFSISSRLVRQFAVKDESWIPYYLYYDAWRTFMLGDQEGSVKLYKKCEKHFRNLGLIKDAVEAKISIARVYQSMGERKTAIRYYEEAANYLESNQEMRPRAVAFALHSLSDMYLQNLELRKATDNLKKAIRLLSSTNNESISFGIATAFRNLGNIYRIMGNWKIALLYYRKSLKSARLQRNRGEEAHTLNCIAITHLQSGNLIRANEYAQMSLDVHTMLHDFTWQALDLAVHGEIAVIRNQYALAMSLYDQAVEQLKSNFDKRLLASVLSKKIFLLIEQGNVNDAIYFINNVRDLTQNLCEKRIDLIFFELDAWANISMGNKKIARKILKKCLEEYEKSGIVHKEADISWLLSKAYIRQNSVKALEYYQKAKSGFGKLKYNSPYFYGRKINF